MYWKYCKEKGVRKRPFYAYKMFRLCRLCRFQTTRDMFGKAPWKICPNKYILLGTFTVRPSKKFFSPPLSTMMSTPIPPVSSMTDPSSTLPLSFTSIIWAVSKQCCTTIRIYNVSILYVLHLHRYNHQPQ